MIQRSFSAATFVVVGALLSLPVYAQESCLVSLNPRILGKAPDPVESLPLSLSSRYQPGNVQVLLRIDSLRVDTADFSTTLTGRVLGEDDATPLAGIQLQVFRIDPAQSPPTALRQAIAIANEEGRFALRWGLRAGDVLIGSLLGHLECVVPVGEQILRALKRPASSD